MSRLRSGSVLRGWEHHREPQGGRAWFGPGYDYSAAPHSQARVTVRMHDGREWSQHADGARGYPGRLTDEELSAKFADCAARTLGASAARDAWNALTAWLAGTQGGDVRAVTAIIAERVPSPR